MNVKQKLKEYNEMYKKTKKLKSNVSEEFEYVNCKMDMTHCNEYRIHKDIKKADKCISSYKKNKTCSMNQSLNFSKALNVVENYESQINLCDNITDLLTKNNKLYEEMEFLLSGGILAEIYNSSNLLSEFPKKLRIGYFTNFPPVSSQDKGMPVGYEVELIREIFREISTVPYVNDDEDFPADDYIEFVPITNYENLWLLPYNTHLTLGGMADTISRINDQKKFLDRKKKSTNRWNKIKHVDIQKYIKKDKDRNNLIKKYAKLYKLIGKSGSKKKLISEINKLVKSIEKDIFKINSELIIEDEKSVYTWTLPHFTVERSMVFLKKNKMMTEFKITAHTAMVENPDYAMENFPLNTRIIATYGTTGWKDAFGRLTNRLKPTDNYKEYNNDNGTVTHKFTYLEEGEFKYIELITSLSFA